MLPWGSKSIKSVFFPSLPNADDKFILVVVFPTPPFWLTSEIIEAIYIPPLFIIYYIF